jgi:hypothetical protein
MYITGLDGPFANYCQRLFNQHRLPFYDANSLAKWEIDNLATAVKHGSMSKKRCFCRVTAIDLEAGTCSIKFNGTHGLTRDGVLISTLKATPDAFYNLRF